MKQPEADTLFQKVRNIFNGGASDVYAYQEFDEDERPASVSGESMKRMFQVAQQHRILNVVDELSMRQLRSLFNSATSGFIGELIDTYIQMEASDARLNGMLHARRSAVSRTPPVVTSADEKDARANRAKEIVENNIKHLNWGQLRKTLMDGTIYGTAILENIWARNSDGLLYIKEFKQIDPTLIEQYTTQHNLTQNRYGQIVLREDNLSPARIFLDELPPYKLVVASNETRDGYHDLDGVMRSVARWYVIKTFIIKSWAQYAEVFGFPVPIVKVSEEDFNKNKNLIKQLLQSVGVNRYGIFFKSMEYELHSSSQTSANIEVFEKYIALCNREMAIAVLGQNLTTEVDSGSRAASETHFKVFEDLTRDDLSFLDDIIEDQIVNPMVRVNMPDLPPELYPTYTSKIQRNVDLQTLGLGLQAMSRLVPISKQYIYEVSQIPQPDEADEVIDNSQPDPLMQSLTQN